MLELTRPTASLLSSYIEALQEGSYSNMQLGFGNMPPEEIERDRRAYLSLITGSAPYDVKLAGGLYEVIRHELLWIVDGDRFLGSIALRYAGAPEILEIYAGHIGMAIRPALLNRGYGPRTVLRLRGTLVDRLRVNGLEWAYATCHPENAASRRLIEFSGGVLMERTEDAFGKGPSLRFRIDFAEAQAADLS